jgi:uncharacterized cupredoxin-like copper-binding protein
MNTPSKIALIALLAAHIGVFGFSATVQVTSASCKQKQNQAQTINCGNINAPLTMNATGGGQIYFAPTNCYISAGQSASQNATCIASSAA